MRFLSDAASRLRVGKHVYVVGGAVRDFALGMPIKDVDVVIDSVALKGKDSEWFAKKLQRAIPARTKLVTNNYGVAILTVSGPWKVGEHDLQGEVIEIANAREESYGGDSGKGYKPSEVAAADIKKDVYRREFTFNTLMWRLSDLAKGPDKAEIVDITGCGMRDLKRGEMACPSDPDKTFRDDPTRMLRAIKFLVRYDWTITPEVRDSIRRNASLLKKVPHEAVVSLLMGSVLKEKTYKKALREMEKLGLLDVVSEMTQHNKAMRATLGNWAANKKAQFFFAMIDAGLPVGSKIGFLSASDQKRLRELALKMEPGKSERFIEVLKQPGKVMDTKALMSELGIKGKAVGRLTELGREVLLERPALMDDPGKLSAAVMRAAKKEKLGEQIVRTTLILDEAEFNEGRARFDALMEKREMGPQLAFFDFDNTLFKSPMRPDWFPAKLKWWSHPSSLNPPCVPANPDKGWWNGRVVKEARKAIADQDIYAVLATGRHDRKFRWRVPELLRGNALQFDEVHLAPGDSSTLKWKLGLLTRLIKRFPQIQTVHIFEDRDRINDFERHVKKFGRVPVAHRVTEAVRNVGCTEEEWKEIWG